MSKTSKSVKDNFSSSAARKFTAALLAAAAVFTPMTGKLGNTFDGSALAQDTVPVKHHREMTALEKGDAARRFSIHNEGIGVFVNFAAVPELAPERLTKAIEANFANKGIPTDIRTNISRGNATTVTFFLKGTPFGGPDGDGYFLGEIPDGFNTVVKAFQQEQARKAAPAELHSAIR